VNNKKNGPFKELSGPKVRGCIPSINVSCPSIKNKAGDSCQGSKAREYCFLLLKFRLRSEKELAQRLKKKNFSPGIIKDTIEFLKEKKFIADEVFARMWIASRIKKNLGLRRLGQELSLKGINKEIIDREIESIKENYSEDKVVEEIVQKKLSSLKGLNSQKAKNRICGYLMRRGFSAETIYNSINKIKDAD